MESDAEIKKSASRITNHLARMVGLASQWIYASCQTHTNIEEPSGPILHFSKMDEIGDLLVLARIQGVRIHAPDAAFYMPVVGSVSCCILRISCCAPFSSTSRRKGAGHG
jgi:hypothetical protein